MADRTKARQLAAESLKSGDPTGWFEKLYAEANNESSVVPWADMRPNPNLVSWLACSEFHTDRVLVIGCGLGDDAEALSLVSSEVIAFDISPTAISWCKQRFPASKVQYCVQDLLCTSFEWQEGFDFVLESYTLQVLPPSVRAEARRKIASFVAPHGRLLVICRGRDEGDDEGNMPWPLTKDEVQAFADCGLTETRFEDYVDNETPPARRFRVEYSRF